MVAISRAAITRTENSEEVEKDEKQKDTVQTIPTGSLAAELEAGPEVEVLKSVIKRYYVIQNTSLNALNNEYELETGSVLSGKRIWS